MRLIACIAVLLTVPAVAATVWKWRDADGVIHYSDQPVQGAEKVTVQSSSTFTSPSAGNAATPTATSAAPPADYSKVEIWKPGNDEAIANSGGQVSVAVRVEPSLQAGDRLALYLDGTLVSGFPQQGMEYQLTGVERGTHSLQLVVVNPQGKPTKTSAPVQFHVLAPSVLNPNSPLNPGRRRP